MIHQAKEARSLILNASVRTMLYPEVSNLLSEARYSLEELIDVFERGSDPDKVEDLARESLQLIIEAILAYSEGHREPSTTEHLLDSYRTLSQIARG